MDKSVIELGTELIDILEDWDDILYPELGNNRSRAYISVFATLTTLIELGYDTDRVKVNLQDKIDEVQARFDKLANNRIKA